MHAWNVHPDCREFVAGVEELLSRRQQDLAAERFTGTEDEWGPRLWTRTELEDTVYSSYKQMRRGRITRPPKREMVMEIANYLNCTVEERNRLLVAAQSAPIDVYLTGARLDERLQPAIEIANALGIPAMIINRDWRIHFLNAQMLALYDLTPAQVEAVPAAQRNVVRLIFDPNLPLYPNLISNTSSWTRMARQTLYGFKTANRLCAFDGWYQDLVAEWLHLPNFEHHWKTVRTDLPFDHDASVRNLSSALLLDTALPGASSRRSWLRPLVISVGYFQFDFPQIVAFLPADEEARLSLAEIGAITT